MFVAVAVAAFAGADTASWSAPVRAAESAPRSTILSSNPSSTYNTLYGVSVASATDAWAVGSYTDDTTGATDTLILHWDGTTWSQVSSPNPSSSANSLTGVSAVSSTDVWAVGSYQGAFAGKTLTLHWDGTSWSQVKSANPRNRINGLSAVSAESADDVWAVGFTWDDLAFEQKVRASRSSQMRLPP